MRVLFISTLYPPNYIGGYEIACSEVVRGLIGRGHEVLVLTAFSHVPAPPEPEYIDRCLDLRWFWPYPISVSVNDYNAFEASCSNLQNTYEVTTALRRFNPDVVYCWNLHGVGGLAILDLLTMVGVPWVLHLMDDVPGYLINHTPAKVRAVFTRANYDVFRNAKIVAISAHLLSEVRENTGITFRREAEIIPGWVACEKLPLRRDYQINGRTRFVMAGAIKTHKGMDVILEAAGRLLREGINSFEIDFYGSGATEHYLSVAIGLGLQKQVRFLGERKKSELLQQYQDYDVFLFPTWEREPFGMAPVEAAACGSVPIITGNCGVAERLVGGVHCLKIERTAEALSDAMRSILLKQVDLPAIGRAAATLVRSDLAFERCLARIEEVLEAERRTWERSVLSDIKLPLLIHTKHHLARFLTVSC
jgi:glycosyltransferase involved in cell wall biosynthesis